MRHRIEASRRHRGPHTSRLRRALLAGALTLGATAGALVSGPAAAEASVADDDWLGVVNAYRSQSGLDPVVEDPTWSEGAHDHSCWMLLNGIAHDEASGTPGYTTGGDEAGNAANVAVSNLASTTPRRHIELWMTGPFHAIGVLRPDLTTVGFGMCSTRSNPSTTDWQSGATLDVVRGNDWGAPDPAEPILFPGDGATTSLTRFVAESPDPRSFCGWDGRAVGLPLLALMPEAVSAAEATLTGPSGPLRTCVLHGANTTGDARILLDGENAVVVVPSIPLERGTYDVSVTADGGDVAWSFDVDPAATLDNDRPAPGLPARVLDLRQLSVL